MTKCRTMAAVSVGCGAGMDAAEMPSGVSKYIGLSLKDRNVVKTVW